MEFRSSELLSVQVRIDKRECMYFYNNLVINKENIISIPRVFRK